MKRPLSFSGNGPGQPKGPPTRFSVQATLEGFEVVDFDGRPVDTRQLSQDAEAVVRRLNEAASAGSWAVARSIERL